MTRPPSPSPSPSELLRLFDAMPLGVVHTVNERVADYAAAARPGGAQSYEEFNRTQTRLDNAARAITLARAAYRQALEVVEDRKREWSGARQRVAALERLESRRRDEHAIELRREEDRLVDDLVVARHVRGEHV